MERMRLNEAAKTGNVEVLLELLQEDDLLLDRVMVAYSATENPLHIAAMLGHVAFAREIISRKPELIQEMNSQGLSPLHLASANGHAELVKEMVSIDRDSTCCYLRDQEGNIALHVAVIKGRIEIVNEFVHFKKELTREVTDRGESILHLSVKYNQFVIFQKFVEDEELVNNKDEDGNTVLHLAVAKRQIQMIKLLLDNEEVEVNAVNANCLTALDVLLQCPAQLGDLLIGEMLRSAGALRAADISPLPSHLEIQIDDQPSSQSQMTTRVTKDKAKKQELINKKKNKKKKKKDKENGYDGSLRQDANTLMVVAVLIATMTFEAGLNPPPDEDSYFRVVDSVGFISSLIVIVLIIIGFPFNKRYLMWVLMIIMMIAIISVGVLFFLWMGNSVYGFALFSIALTGLLFLWLLVRLVTWLIKKCGTNSKGEKATR